MDVEVGTRPGCDSTLASTEHERLASALKRVKAKFLVSYNDHERMRELYSWAFIEHVQIRFAVVRAAGARQQRVTELLMRKYSFEER